jgi:hypothetical protein
MSRNASTDELYFATLTVTDWIDVFTRHIYNDFISRKFNVVPTATLPRVIAKNEAISTHANQLG